MRNVFLFLLLVLGIGGSMALQAAPDPFEAANEAYQRGDFAAAQSDYEALVADGELAANLFYNLGNTYYRTDKKGAAMLAYERALALQPSHPEAAANLSLLRNETGARIFPPGPLWERALAWPEQFTNRRAIWVAAFGFWLFCVSLAPRLWRRPGSMLGALVGLILLGWFGGSAFWSERQPPVWIVTGPRAEVRMEPADNSKLATTLPTGSQVRLLLDRGEWLYVLLPNQVRGWIHRNLAEPVALVKTKMG